MELQKLAPIINKIYSSPVHQLEPGTLFIIPTPIGNVEDFTLRGLRILSEVDWIAAEDTRHTGLLLHRLGIKKKLISYHKHNEKSRLSNLVESLMGGSIGALVSDAGTPGISDPGQILVSELVDQGLKVVALPGACALTTALSASGLTFTEFQFAGFPPVKSGQRLKRMMQLKESKMCLLFYESPHKMPRFLSEAKDVFPDKRMIIARELSKKFEEFLRGTPHELYELYKDKKWKGELVILINNSEN